MMSSRRFGATPFSTLLFRGSTWYDGARSTAAKGLIAIWLVFTRVLLFISVAITGPGMLSMLHGTL